MTPLPLTAPPRAVADVLGLILAGGLARRFGGSDAAPVDKALLPLAGRPLLAHVRDRLAPQVAALALNANGDPTRYAGFALPILPDPVPGYPGPLAGVLAGLEHATVRDLSHVLSAPADCPALPPDLAARLTAALAGAAPDAISVAASAGRRHPVVALWPVTLAPALRQALTGGERRVGAVQARYPLLVIDFPATPADPFLNINTPEDLAVAERMSGGAPTLRESGFP